MTGAAKNAGGREAAVRYRERNGVCRKGAEIVRGRQGEGDEQRER